MRHTVRLAAVAIKMDSSSLMIMMIMYFIYHLLRRSLGHLASTAIFREGHFTSSNTKLASKNFIFVSNQAKTKILIYLSHKETSSNLTT